jgi:hypothetical protein
LIFETHSIGILFTAFKMIFFRYFYPLASSLFIIFLFNNLNFDI